MTCHRTVPIASPLLSILDDVHAILSGQDGCHQGAGNAVPPFATARTGSCAPTHRPVPIDMCKTKDAIVIYADVPGVQKHDISLDVESTNGNTLAITVNKNDAKTEQKDAPQQAQDSSEQAANGEDSSEPAATKDDVKWLRKERLRPFVKRTLRLPEHADLSKATATYSTDTAGVLTITVPFRSEAEIRSKRIEIV